MLPPWTKNYIGIPYAAHGRAREGADCYGFIRLVLVEYGHNLPLFAHDYDPSDRSGEARLIGEGLPLIGAHGVEERAPGDIVLIRYLAIPSHVGVYIGDDTVLHLTEGKASCIESLSSSHLASRIVGYYRVD